MPLQILNDNVDHQGGKKFGLIKAEQERNLNEINEEYLHEDAYKDVEDLEEKLQKYKAKFIEYDQDGSGDLNIMDVKYMMEKLDQAKTHLQVKKMISEVDTSGLGVISYRDFLTMMLGKKNSVLKLILKFEEITKEKEKPKGPPPKRDLASLP